MFCVAAALDLGPLVDHAWGISVQKYDVVLVPQHRVCSAVAECDSIASSWVVEEFEELVEGQDPLGGRK